MLPKTPLQTSQICNLVDVPLEISFKKILDLFMGKPQTNNKKQISQISLAPHSRRFPSSPDSGTQSCQKSNGQSGGVIRMTKIEKIHEKLTYLDIN